MTTPWGVPPPSSASVWFGVHVQAPASRADWDEVKSRLDPHSPERTRPMSADELPPTVGLNTIPCGVAHYQ